MNKSVCIIGGGRSILEGIKLDLWNRLKESKIEIWSLNYAYKTLPYPPTREIWVDTSFFNNNSQVLPTLNQQGVKLYAKAHSRYAIIPEIIQYFATSNKSQYYGKKAIEQRILYCGRMKLCGIFALSLAIAEGYNIIYLCGYDFGTPTFNTDKTHYYQDEINVISAGVGKPEIYLKPDGSVNDQVEDFGIFMKEEDVKIYNVSLISNIPYYPKISYEEFFTKLNEQS